MSGPHLFKRSFHLLLLVLSFTTTATETLAGSSGDSLVASLPVDAVALLSFKSNADLDNKLLYTTNEHFDYCQWQGVKCAQGRIVRYVVQSFGLRGTVAAGTLARLDQLRVLSLRNNTLFGPLPDFSQLVNLKSLFLDHNYFAGNFPVPILSLHRLLVLDLSHNNFTGLLPANLTALDRLGYLRLESNRFYGPIPPLNQTTLEVFDASNNNLSGPIPATPTLKRFKISSFLGNNPNLCGEVVNKPCKDYPFFNQSSGAAADGGTGKSPPSPLLQNADSQLGLRGISHEKHHKKVGLVLGSATGTLVVLAAVLSLFALIRKRREDREDRELLEASHLNSREAATNTKKKETTLLKPQDEHANTDTTAHSYESSKQEAAENRSPEQQIRVVKSGSLVFCSGEEELYDLDQLMRASAELLGRGTLGTTYKAVMANQLIVTVKRLDACKIAITSGDVFEHHMETVGALRHPNLVPVRAYFQARQERLIVYDYQPNGSLYNLIHGSRSTRAKPLHWTSCLKIAEDIAQGLAYIHQASKQIHGNLKSSNILLGSDFEACITDYCLTTLTDNNNSTEDPDSSSSSSSYSYKAPEVGKSVPHKPTVKSDVYAFGVLLLELLTGKLPSHHPFLAPPDVPDWVRAMRVDDGDDDVRLGMLVEVASICRVASPEQRPSMWQVLKMIMNIKEIMDDSTKDDDGGAGGYFFL